MASAVLSAIPKLILALYRSLRLAQKGHGYSSDLHVTLILDFVIPSGALSLARPGRSAVVHRG